MFKKFINFINTLIFFRIKKIKIGKFPYMRGIPIVDNCGKIEIGDNFRATNKQFKIQITTDKSAEIKIGNNVFINQGANIYANKRIEIKDNVFIADLCSIYDTNFHEVEENKGVKVKEVIIHENVWLCRNVIVIAGSEIGKILLFQQARL